MLLYSLSMTSHPNNISDSQSSVTIQSSSPKTSRGFTTQATMRVGSRSEDGKFCVLLKIPVQLFVAGSLLPSKLFWSWCLHSNIALWAAGLIKPGFMCVHLSAWPILQTFWRVPISSSSFSHSAGMQPCAPRLGLCLASPHCLLQAMLSASQAAGAVGKSFTSLQQVGWV